MTLGQALARARERSSALATARVNEARGEWVGASAFLRSNPEVSAAAGARLTPTSTGPEVEVSLQQRFELGGRRAARLASAQAEILRAGEAGEDFQRLFLREVAVAFLRVLQANERVRLAGASRDVAAELAHSAERRFKAGDLPVLDHKSAVVAHARSTADHCAAVAARATAIGELRGLLALPSGEPINPIGSLDPSAPPALAQLLATADARADLEALRAAIEQADAEARLGAAGAWPEVGLGAQYKREGQDNVVLGLASFTLPIFDRGRGLEATARARAVRLRLELDAAQRAVAAQIEAAFDAARSQAEAADALRKVVPTLDESDALALKAFTAGEISIRDLLLLRRQVLETRLAFADQLFAASAAAIELQAQAGVLR